MEQFGPSLLYCITDLLTILVPSPVTRQNFVRDDSPSLYGNSLEDVIRVLCACGFLFEDSAASLHLTDKGRTVMTPGGQVTTREIVFALIGAYRPRWIRLIPQGRRECLPNLPERVRQCFEEAGLADQPASPECIDWWSRASRLARSYGNDLSYDTGARGEQLTLEFESRRTGRIPEYVALETTRAGFDVLSVVDSANEDRLRVEVKASIQRKSEAYFVITENEWAVAESQGNHCFHLWLLTEGARPRLAVLQVTDVKPHIPINQGSGRWFNTRVPFKQFGFLDVTVS